MITSSVVIERTISLMIAIAKGGSQRSLAACAAELSIPYSTAHRMARQLQCLGVLAPAAHGHYTAGLALLDALQDISRTDILIQVARPPLRRLAIALKSTVHLGVWDSDMVTYLIKEVGRKDDLFTVEGGQLEAYCSAIGKVLLSSLDIGQQHSYLAAGPFVSLTPNTITDPAQLDAVIASVQTTGYALDRREVSEDLQCVAVPVHRNGTVIAAISLSQTGPGTGLEAPPAALLDCARQISARLSPGRC